SRNFGLPAVLEHKARYDRAKEFAEVVHALWDSWEDDAFVGNKAGARFVDTSKVHPIAHRGAHYSVAGPLNVPRSPQGRPVTVQARCRSIPHCSNSTSPCPIHYRCRPTPTTPCSREP